MRLLKRARGSTPSRGRPRPVVRTLLAAGALFAASLAGLPGQAHAAAGSPFGGTPVALPGLVQAANYDTGGQGVAYNVTATNGTANSYRADSVDLETTADTSGTSSAGGAYDMGWTTPGQWFNYTVSVATAGTYSVAFRLSSPYGIADALHIADASGANLTGSVAVPNTGGYETWATVTASLILPAGTQTLTVKQDTNGWNFHNMAFTLTSSGGGGGSGDKPFGGTRRRCPARCRSPTTTPAVRASPTTSPPANGSANSYRTDGVDLEATARHAGHQSSRRRRRHGLDRCRTVVPLHGPGGHQRCLHRQLPRGAPAAIADALHIADSTGANLSGAVAVPTTGGYQTWATVTATVTLAAGAQTLTVAQDAAGFNIHFLSFAQGTNGGGAAARTQYCGYQDLALDQPTTASSTYSATGNLAAAATDGDPGTRWESAYSDPQWLEVDLGSQTSICAVALLWEAAYASAFQIQIVHRQHDLEHGLLHDHRHRREPVVHVLGDRPLHPDVRHRARDAVGRLRLRVRRLRPDEHPPLSGGTGNGGNGVCPWVGSTAPVAQRVQQVLTTMNQTEEFTLLSGDGSSSYIGQVAAIPNLCIPPMNMQDGPTGVGDGTGGVTAYPDGESAASTWDPALIQQEGTAKGAEFAGKGVNVSLGPTTNLVRDPRWGRTYETYGEDPFLAGQITSAQVRACRARASRPMVKHVAAYDQETYPNGGNNEIVSTPGHAGAVPGSVPGHHRAVRTGLVHVLLRGRQRHLVLRRTPTCTRNSLDDAGELRRLHHLRLGRRRQQRRRRRRRHGHRDAVHRSYPDRPGQRPQGRQARARTR